MVRENVITKVQHHRNAAAMSRSVLNFEGGDSVVEGFYYAT